MRHQQRPRTLPLGSLAEATCRAEDRIDGLLWALRPMRLSRADRAKVRKLQAEYDEWAEGNMRDTADLDPEAADHILQELCDVAEGYLPAYCYLGTPEGDGADFGVWASVDQLLEDRDSGEVWQVTEDQGRHPIHTGPDVYFRIMRFATRRETVGLDRLPRGVFYVRVSDHGNVSLYQSLGAGKSREIWGVV